MCDLAYALLVEQLERQYLADRTGLVTAGYMSGGEFTIPSWQDELDGLDERLNAEPERAEPLAERDVVNNLFRRALGVVA